MSNSDKKIVVANIYDGWGVCLKSKISHFIGSTNGLGKPKQFLDRVDLYLKQHGFA